MDACLGSDLSEEDDVLLETPSGYYALEQVSPESFGSDMDTHTKRVMSDPDGNIYRGWAIGMFSTRNETEGRLLFLTVLVVIVQLVGPVFIYFWARRTFMGMHIEPVWSKWRGSYNATLTANQTWDENAYRNWGWNDDTVWSDIQKKFLGAVLMLLLFQSNDRLMLRMDMQTDKLRKFFRPHLSLFWMWMDVICNALPVMFTAFNIVPIFLSCGDVKDLILDSFGFFFLISLDDFSGTIEYGLDTSEFDDLIDDYKAVYLKELRRKGIEHELEIDEWWTNELGISDRFKWGDFIFTVARMINMLLMCGSLPVYVVFVAVGIQPGDKPVSLGTQLWDQKICFLPTAAILYAMLLTYDALKFWLYRFGEYKDCTNFLYVVFFRRPDPRLPDLSMRALPERGLS